MDLSLENVTARLANYEPGAASRLLATQRAAVTVLLRYNHDVLGPDSRPAPEVLLIKRAVRADDRWSGQVSLPGGREQDEDGGELLATAIRETQEEVGIDLAEAALLLGRLGATQAIAKGKLMPLSITPFVFVQISPVTVSLNHEATSSFWLPLERAGSGELDGIYPYKMGPVSFSLRCWHWQNQIIWGLTHRMLSEFLQVVADH